MIRSRGIMLVTVSLAMAFGAAWMANGWLEARAMSSGGAGNDTVPVLAAATAIPLGQRVSAMHVKTLRLPRDVAPPGAYSELPGIEGKVALSSIVPGEILIENRFADHGEGSTLAAMIAPKMRAVSIRVNDVVGVAGFLLPGNRVDVLATRKESRRAETRTILQDIKVLAVDQTAATENNEPVVVRAVTLELSPAQAEELVKGQQEGSIQLTLRNPLDQSVMKLAVIEEEVAPLPRPVARVPARPSSATVTVIRGTDVKKTKIKL